MPPIHQAAAGGFTKGARTYVSGRPDYPQALVVWLRETLGMAAGMKVVDLGAGTGKFIPVLQTLDAEVTAVEPVAAMRAQCMALYPQVRVLDGMATAIPLPDAAADVVVCAQSFHWFARSEALMEIHRVLKTGGLLVLVWNGRDETVPWVAALTKIVNRYETGVPRYASGEWRTVFPAPGFDRVDEVHYSNAHRGKAEQVIMRRVLSTSFIADLPPQEQDRVTREVRALIEATPELAGRDEVSFPYTTSAFAWRKTGETVSTVTG